MIRSMTGYGFGEYDLYNRKVTVEIKSVNSKYLDMSIKLPKVISVYENDIKNIIKEEIFRGKVDVYINIISNCADDVKINVNTSLLDGYFDIFDKICDEYGVLRPTINDIMNINGIITKDDSYSDIDTLAEIWETLFVALNNAISNFIKMRENEGEILKDDMFSKISDIEHYLSEIELLCPMIISEYENRINTKITENLKNMNFVVDAKELEQRIFTEICIFSEKTDIDEEIVRFNTNLTSLKTTLANESTIGKKIDFILQELNREVNTMTSKSNDTRLTSNCIEVKVVLEKIREQAKNIE